MHRFDIVAVWNYRRVVKGVIEVFVPEYAASDETARADWITSYLRNGGLGSAIQVPIAWRYVGGSKAYAL